MSKEDDVACSTGCVVRGDALELLGKEGMPTTLMHCISRDRRMGAGIAKAVRGRWGTPPKEIPIGTAATRKVAEGTVVELVTKDRYWNKPTLADFEGALADGFAKTEGAVLMPKIGCGLDRLPWETQVWPLVQKHAKGREVVVAVLH